MASSEVTDAVVGHLHTTISRLAPSRYLFVHAGAFALGEHVVLVPGRSGVGKTSLVIEAVQRGATYLSDEFGVDRQGRLHPYPREAEVHRRGGATVFLPPDALGGPVADEPMTPTVVLASRYREGARWEPATLEGVDAVPPLIENTVRARRLAKRTIRMAARAAAGAEVLSGPRGEAAETLDLLADHLGLEPA